MPLSSFAPCATPNKMFSNTVSSVGFAWETIFAPNASSLTMMLQRNSIIVTDVIFAESEVGRTFSTVTSVDVVTQRR
ncbi:hypothetical protein FF1_032413 [Malus domestica]